MCVQEQAAALLSQLHQQDPGRVNPQPNPTPRPAFARQARQSLLLTPGMGSVGSVSPRGRGAQQPKDHHALATGHW